MRRFIYYLTASLDGFIARPDGSVDWLLDDDGDDFGFAEFFDGVDTVVMGRKTYDMALSFGEYPYSTKKGFIFSRSLSGSEHAEVVRGPVETFVAEQRALPGKDVWLVGGGETAKAFLQAGAIDELVVFIQPILLGEGLPLVRHLGRDVKLKLKSSRQFPSGLVQIEYEVVR